MASVELKAPLHQNGGAAGARRNRPSKGAWNQREWLGTIDASTMVRIRQRNATQPHRQVIMFSKSSITLASLSLSLSLSLFSCATEQPPIAPTGEAREAHDGTAALAAVPRDFEDGTIEVSKTIRETCGLSEQEAHFRFDSTIVQGADGAMLRDIATCFVDGPLAGESMRLVGHADPRGESEYNLLLGGHRGDSVKTHLVNQGMNPDQISSSSRGELDAGGTDEASWAHDRRVHVMLASER